MSAAGIERKAAFSKLLQLSAGRVGQLLNASDLARTGSVDLTTVQSWLALLEQNGILRIVQPYFSNINQRLIKTPKIYFEDVGLCTRLQGWTELSPLLVSPYLDSLIENTAFAEISRFFSNRGEPLNIFFLRSKEQVEIDFLIQLPNQRFVAVEVKTTPRDFTLPQLKLLDSLKINILERWVFSPESTFSFQNCKNILFEDIFSNLSRIWK